MQLEARIATVRMAETFVISRGASDEAEVVYVEIRHEGVSGFGEAAPIERYDESARSALEYVQEHAEALGDDPFALDGIEAGETEIVADEISKQVLAGLSAGVRGLYPQVA